MTKILLQPGENVRHRRRAEWGIGKIIDVNSAGTVGVVFEGNRILSIAKGLNYLIKVDSKGNKI
jgi:alpha-tubulin suppressor-like RCC1 family protein